MSDGRVVGLSVIISCFTLHASIGALFSIMSKYILINILFIISYYEYRVFIRYCVDRRFSNIPDSRLSMFFSVSVCVHTPGRKITSAAASELAELRKKNTIINEHHVHKSMILSF